MIDEKRLSEVTLYDALPIDSIGHSWAIVGITEDEAEEILRLARVGLLEDQHLSHIADLELQVCRFKTTVKKFRPLAEWAENHGIPALENAAKQVTWVSEKNQEVTLTYGFHIEHCQKALATLPKESTDG